MSKLNKKGFTLAELLVVVGIIAVLVAISIPVFSSQTEKAKQAVDLANIRSAYAQLADAVISEDRLTTKGEGGNGKLVSNSNIIYQANKSNGTEMWATSVKLTSDSTKWGSADEPILGLFGTIVSDYSTRDGGRNYALLSYQKVNGTYQFVYRYNTSPFTS